MKFKHGTRRRALEYEKDWVKRWKDEKTFEKSVEKNPKSQSYVFYDGPPFITGVPHHGTLLSSIVKDAVPRYWTMKGRRVERVWGWDCHGLPAEVFTEKKLGIKDRRDIGTKISLEDYITTARENMVQTSSLWNDTVDRIGRWVDMDNAYKTMDKEYMESIWWAFKELYNKKKIYEGERVLMYCTRDATPLSKAEVTMDAGAYQDVTDPSVYVKFKIKDFENGESGITNDVSLLAWTTTPWTLPANSALAVNKDLDYAEVKVGDERFILAKSLIPKVFTDEKHQPLEYEIVREMKGSDLVGLEYEPLFENRGEGAHKVWAADYVSAEDGTGIVHLAPAYGEEDFNLAKASGIPVVHVIDENGLYSEGEWQGENVWDINKTIAKQLHEAKANPVDVNVVILHGIDGKAGIHWQQWLHDKLAKLGCNVIMPMLPQANHPDRRSWLAEVEAIMKPLDPEKTIIVGHSLGVPTALDYLERLESGRLLGLVSVAGFAEPLNAELNDYFMKEKSIDLAVVREHVRSSAVIYGDDDPYVSQTALAALAEGLGVQPIIVKDGGHINTDAGYTELKLAFDKIVSFAKLNDWRGVVWKIEYIRHSYPHCHRCNTRLMYRAHPSWFFDVQGQKEVMLAKNTEQIEWFPEHLKHGRFEKNIEQAPDWNLSRDRFWATAMPVWEGVDKNGKKQQIVVGSYDELEELSGKRLDDYHRPWVDDIEFDKDGVHYKRIEKVLDGWFESGSMPFAQFHYPFENKDKFEANFPGDFVVEYIGQVRAWFYYMHVVSTGLFGESPFKHVVTTGIVAGNDGRKMSKSYGNYTDPNELMDKFSADSLRFLLLSSPLLNGEDFALQDKDVGDVARKLSMIWNMYDFFTMYAEVDGWEFDSKKPFSMTPEDVANPLDKWIVSRVHQLNEHVTKYMDEYNLPDAMSEILPFIEDASNWYVRRSRRRFWKSEDDGDKADAYKTLHYILLKLSTILAPFTPFLSEELYHQLGGGEESVHLLSWPTNYTVDQLVLDEMKQARAVINDILSLRAKEGIKTRQPLRYAKVESSHDFRSEIREMVIDEVNIKEIDFVQNASASDASVDVDLKLTPELRREGMMREVIRHVQSARKAAGLNVNDRIVLHLETENEELQKAIDEHSKAILAETLAKFGQADGYSADVKVDGAEMVIQLAKV